jgi:hypothetical protein
MGWHIIDLTKAADELIRKEVLYNILTKFSIANKL